MSTSSVMSGAVRVEPRADDREVAERLVHATLVSGDARAELLLPDGSIVGLSESLLPQGTAALASGTMIRCGAEQRSDQALPGSAESDMSRQYRNSIVVPYVGGLQRGFVTPRNARELGVPPVELPKLAARGALDLEHCAYGLYRIDGYPAQPGDEYVEAVLWAGGGHISHESAMAVWELADVNPRRINLTVPKRVRRSGATSYRLWVAQLVPRDVDEHLGIPVTTLLRSVVDAAAAGTDPRLIEQAIDNIERRRLASVGDVKEFKKAFADRAVA